MKRDLEDTANGVAYIVKTDKDFNIIWRKDLPNGLKFSRATQIKEYNDTLFVSTFHWSPPGSVAFPFQPVRSQLFELDSAGNLLKSVQLSSETTVFHAAYDFERMVGAI